MPEQISAAVALAAVSPSRFGLVVMKRGTSEQQVTVKEIQSVVR